MNSRACIVEILYTMLFEMAWFPDCVVGIGGVRQIELLGRACPCE